MQKSVTFFDVVLPVSRKQEQDLKLNTCIRTISPNNGDEDTCDVSCDYCLEIKEFMIKDNMAATNITPPRARKDRSLITGAGTSIMQTGIDDRLESRSLRFPKVNWLFPY